MATMQLPATGYGLRYEYGMFRQAIENGWQREYPDNWLHHQDPWEVARPSEAVEVKLGCSFEMHRGKMELVAGRPSTLIGIPFDRPVVGFGGKTINTLRLWRAAAHDYFDFKEFSGGDFVGALVGRIAASTLTRVLYPDDSTEMGQELRFAQEYFLVACSLADLVRRFRRDNTDWNAFPDKVAIQLNDTHPTLAVPELMRILLDEAGSAGTRPGTSRSEPWPTPITRCCRRRSSAGRCITSSRSSRGSSRSSSRSTAVSWTTSGAAIATTRPASRA